MRKFICLFLALICILSAISFAFADPGVVEGVGGTVEMSSTSAEMFGISEKDLSTSEGLFGVSKADTDIDKIGSKLRSKGLKVIEAIKYPCEVICVIGFIFCCVMAVIGAVQKGPMLGKALLGALLAALAYGAIVYAEDIIAMIVAFMGS